VIPRSSSPTNPFSNRTSVLDLNAQTYHEIDWAVAKNEEGKPMQRFKQPKAKGISTTNMDLAWPVFGAVEIS